MAEERGLASSEAHEVRGYRDGKINTDLASLNLLLELANSSARASEDSSTVTVLVVVDQLDGLIQSIDSHHREDRSEDLLRVGGVVDIAAIDDGGSDVVAVSFDLHATH